MNRRPDPSEEAIDRIADGIRNENIDDSIVEAATARVWDALNDQTTVEAGLDRPLRTCADFQALIPAYVGGELPEARNLLVHDHTRECLACRRVLIEQRTGGVQAPASAPTPMHRRTPAVLRMAAAVLMMVATGLLGTRFVVNSIADKRVTAAVAEIDGALQLVTTDGSRPLVPGEVLRAGQTVRTTKSSDALIRLADGSTIEMNQRAELNLRGRWNGTRIELERGDIIVHAADQGAGRLFVATEDCLVAVKGTIFAVNHGLKGSRVSVVEGAVEVSHGGETSSLKPGDQMTTDARLAHVSVESEIAWSRNAEAHIGLLRELTGLRREIVQAMNLDERRTSTRLLGLSPPDTVVFVAMPNLTDGMDAAQQVLASRLAQSEVLAEWWQQQMTESGIEDEINNMIERLQPLGETVGDEVAVTVTPAAIAETGGPLLLALLDEPATFRSLLEEEIERINQEQEDGTALLLVDDPSTAPPEAADVYLYIDGDVFAASMTLDELQRLASRLGSGANDFADTQLYARLAEAYNHGIGWLLGMDVQTLLTTAGAEDPAELASLDALGLLDATTLIAERHREDDHVSTSASIDFDGPRHGVAAWLAEPAPMGSLDFIGPEATLASAVVTKDPVEMFDELVGFVIGSDPGALLELAQFQDEFGLDLRNDLAAALGGEAAFAIDGPMLPTPAWKVVIEVYDPATLQHTIALAVERANEEMIAEGRLGLVLEEHTDGDTPSWEVHSLDVNRSIHYATIDGFLVATPLKVLLNQAIQHRATGTSLPRSAAFQAMLPDNQFVDFSAVVFRDLGALADIVTSSGVSGLPIGNLEELAGAAGPALLCVYGESERITVAGNGPSLLDALPLLGARNLGPNARRRAKPGTGG